MSISEVSLEMNIVDINPHSNMLPRMRTRKQSLDHHANSQLMDNNGNNRQFKRLSSLSELSFEESNELPKDKEEVDDVESNGDENDTPGLDNAVLKHLHSLIRNVQISDTLVGYINKEVLGVEDVNANLENRQRRKSCFTLSTNLGNIAEHNGARTRRQSVSSKANSLPRRKQSSAGLTEQCLPKGSVSHQRRTSVTHANTGRRSSVISAPRSRRNSVQHTDPLLLSAQNGGRRSSVTLSNMHRRSSLAHAYNTGMMQKTRRMSMQTVIGTDFNPANLQRRRSSIKTPCFPVTKIASVQKRLNKIYSRRKRTERASVNIRDVKSAFRQLRKSDQNCEGTESELNSDVNNSDVNNDEFMDENSNNLSGERINVVEDVVGSESDSKDMIEDIVEKSTAGVTNTAQSTLDNDVFEAAPGEIPAPKRKTSIQVRAWELSRKLRQRRREKRKGHAESDII